MLGRSAVRELDRKTIEAGTASIELMERAGRLIAVGLDDYHSLGPCQRLLTLRGRAKRVLILCGSGNNGGDGWVAARHLAQKGWHVEAALCAREPRAGGDAAVNFEKWREGGGTVFDYAQALDALSPRNSGGYAIVLDCLFGTGLDRPLEGRAAALVQAVNRADTGVVAADIASGLCADRGVALGACIRADATITLGAAKPGLFLADGPSYSGRVTVADIGLLELAEAGLQSSGAVLDLSSVAPLVEARDPMEHKGRRGHVLVVGGSPGKSGAVLLAARAALRAGAGLASMAVPDGLAAAVDTALYEAMTIGLPEGSDGCFAPRAWQRLQPLTGDFSAVVTGPGMGTGNGAKQFFGSLLENFDGPIVADADALNIAASFGETGGMSFAGYCSARKQRGAAALLLTPHPGEMARLCAMTTAQVQADRLGCTQELARRLDCVVVLKGAGSIVHDGSRTAYNCSGNPGMAAAGMGDVLSGVAGACLAQRNKDPFSAAALAVFWHGAAGDFRYRQLRAPGFLASEVADSLPRALAAMHSGR